MVNTRKETVNKMPLRKPNIEKTASELTEKLADAARAPLINHLKQLALEKRRLQEAAYWLLFEIYLSEFEMVEGINQHPDGLTFDQWLVQRMRKELTQ